LLDLREFAEHRESHCKQGTYISGRLIHGRIPTQKIDSHLERESTQYKTTILYIPPVKYNDAYIDRGRYW